MCCLQTRDLGDLVGVILSKSFEGLRTRKAGGINPRLKAEDLGPSSRVKQKEERERGRERDRGKFLLSCSWDHNGLNDAHSHWGDQDLLY